MNTEDEKEKKKLRKMNIVRKWEKIQCRQGSNKKKKKNGKKYVVTVKMHLSMSWGRNLMAKGK